MKRRRNLFKKKKLVPPSQPRKWKMKITRYLMTRDFTAHRVQWLHYLLFGGSMLSMVFSSLARRILKKKKNKRQKENRLHRITSTPIYEYSWHCLIMQSTLALQTLCNCVSTVTCSCSFKNLHKLLRSWYKENTGLFSLHHKLCMKLVNSFSRYLS